MITEIQSLNNKYLGIIYKGVCNLDSFRTIYKNLVLITEKESKYGKQTYKILLKIATKIAKKITKEAKNVDLSFLPLFAYSFFQKNDSYHELLSCNYNLAQEYEAKEKQKIIKESLDLADKKTEYELDRMIFYLCSKHSDCAKDHQPYQGKIYVDKRWKSYIKNNSLREQIESFIGRHNILTFQDITFRPVWLFTRPNCRHFYQQLSVDEVLSNSINNLLKQHDLILMYGSETHKTIRHSTDKSWYTRSNIESIIQKYKQRLSYHEELYSIQRIEPLKTAIEKDRTLIKKWQNYLQNIK